MSFVTFFVLAALAVGSAAGLLLRRNPIHGALFLVVNLGTIAALFLTLRAEFLAAVQVIVYAGAIAVLFVFAIMVLIPGKEETGPDPLHGQRLLSVPVVGVYLALVAFGQRHGTTEGQALVFFVMCVAAAEVAVGLAIIVATFRQRRRLSVDELSTLRG